MPSVSTFEAFQDELARLVETFGRNLDHYKGAHYDEASVRQEFLNPVFRHLGWDMENRAGVIPQHREVEIESRTDVGGRQKRADYLFRTDRIDRFICEAKKPAEELRGYAFQAKRYAWNKGLYLAVLSDFEELWVYVVGSRPHPDEADVGLYRSWHFNQFPLVAREIWDLLSRDAVAAGGIEKLVESLPKKSASKGKARQQWLIKPDRTRALDTDFLNFLDEARRTLAQDLLKNNDRDYLLSDNRINEAVQRILDRLLFLRICEDRDIDTGRPLVHILHSWRDRNNNPVPRKIRQPLLVKEESGIYEAGQVRRGPLWRDVVAHFRALDRRPPSHIPFFNGNLFKEHFIEDLEVGNEWLAGFLDDVSDEESPYLFNVIPVEILGTIYERFLGKVVRPHGRGVVIEEKPEVRKAGGVYYTPRYIVDYIVEQTVGKLLADKTPEKSLELRILDPACGSGSFLIRAYERVCEHWLADLTKHKSKRRREICWTDEGTGDVHLTTDRKRRILTANIFGVDLDSGAVEVTQLSLYLKMLEGENRQTLARERDLFGNDIALLPALQDNIKCGNSLIASDVSMIPDDLLRVRAFDWPEQFRGILKAGGFDAVIGNPPWGADLTDEDLEYFERTFAVAKNSASDTYALFVERATTILRQGGRFSFIVPDTFLRKDGYKSLRELLLRQYVVEELIETGPVFSQVRDTWCLVFTLRRERPTESTDVCHKHVSRFIVAAEDRLAKFAASDFDHVGQVCQQYWVKRPEMIIGYLSSISSQELIAKIERHPRLRDLSDKFAISRGEEGSKFKVEQVEHGGYHMVIPENVHRYDLSTGTPVSQASFSDGKLKSFYTHPKIWIVRIQKMRWPQRIVSVVDTRRNSGAMKTLQVIVSTTDDESSLKYLQAILASKLLNFWCVNYLADDMNQAYLERLPVAICNLEIVSERERYVKLVALVEKMLALVTKSRAAKSEGERATLQNAVAATDRLIDAMIYELYGLTTAEIALIEAGGAT